jgi:Ca2+/Na+ antiporter
MIVIIALLLIQLVEPYINNDIALLLMITWMVAFAIDAIYTYNNRALIKSKESNIIMHHLYGKIPYPLIIVIILALELAMILALSYLYTQAINSMMRITNIGLTMIVFAYLHIEAFIASNKTIKRL